MLSAVVHRVQIGCQGSGPLTTPTLRPWDKHNKYSDYICTYSLKLPVRLESVLSTTMNRSPELSRSAQSRLCRPHPADATTPPDILQYRAKVGSSVRSLVSVRSEYIQPTNLSTVVLTPASEQLRIVPYNLCLKRHPPHL